MPRYTHSPPRPAFTNDFTLPGTNVQRRYLTRDWPNGPEASPAVITTNRRSIRNYSQMSAGLRTPSYFPKVNSGFFVDPLPLSGRRYVNNYGVGRLVHDYGGIILDTRGYEPQTDSWAVRYPGGAGAAFDARLANECLIKVRLKLKDQKVNLAQAWMERQQTARLLSDTLSKVSKCINSLLKKDFPGAVRALKLPLTATKKLKRSESAADNWLALQYGWKPLLGDLYGSAELLRQRDLMDPNRYRVSSKATVMRRSTFTPDISEGNSFLVPVDTKRIKTGNVKFSAMIRLDYRLDSAMITRLATSTGFSNPLALAWERTPFSFVADWFFPIGNYLNQLDSTLGLLFQAGSLTQFSEYACTCVWERVGKGVPIVDIRTSVYDRTFSRTVYSSAPFPSLPSFKNPLSGYHLANAAALLSGLKRSTK